MLRRISALVRKEFIQIRRDMLALVLLLALPVFILFIFGYAINLDVRNISFAMLDEDGTAASRRIVERFINSGYFSLEQTISSKTQIQDLLDRGAVKAVVRVPRDFQKTIMLGKSASIQVLIDGTDNNSASIIMSYVKAILQSESMMVLAELMNAGGILRTRASPSVDVRPNIWYNPELSSSIFLVPGIIGIIIMVVGAIRMSVSLVREKEKGTIEGLMVSPLKPWELMVGKVLPYILIVFIDLLLIVVCGKYFFHVPFRGSVLLFIVLSFVFLCSALGSGLFISAISKTSQTAWLMGFLTTMLPSILLSGFIFPIASMPMPVQVITYLLPVRYFLVIIRGIILKGVGLGVLYPQAAILLVFACVIIYISSRKFKKRL